MDLIEECNDYERSQLSKKIKTQQNSAKKRDANISLTRLIEVQDKFESYTSVNTGEKKILRSNSLSLREVSFLTIL